uniref:Uncharacterized protein n=1 Tax=Nelumbo nucifera TaxID=4432 RepID=A0A822ZN73_NELNU|nr:TPA_asm: hypothetical protein HUJ06_004150 [Nelumbo nucifera]
MYIVSFHLIKPTQNACAPTLNVGEPNSSFMFS